MTDILYKLLLKCIEIMETTNKKYYNNGAVKTINGKTYMINIEVEDWTD